jgi:predicted phosphodiesterase
MGDTGSMRRPLLSVFAVEDTAVQVTWRALPAEEACLEAGDVRVHVTATPPAWLRRRHRRPRKLARRPGAVGGPGAVVIEGLKPATSYDVTVSGPGLPRQVLGPVRTLAPPPGRLLCRFATVNDIHIGERHFGGFGTIEDVRPLPEGWETYPLRCARSALDQAVAWGADTIVVKGDLTWRGTPVELREAGKLLSTLPVPVEAVLGNHEYHSHHVEVRTILAESGIDIHDDPWVRDLPGVRLVFGHSPVPGHRFGAIDRVQGARLAELAGAAPSAAVVVVHHQPQRWPVATAYPPGIGRPQASSFLDVLGAANPASMVATGHTHRHRRRQHGPVLVVETGSTKDYPGTWAGYAVHEGGVRQVVRRTGGAEVMGWTESTYWALGGLWGRWSPGRLGDRCFTHPWPSRPG